MPRRAWADFQITRSSKTPDFSARVSNAPNARAQTRVAVAARRPGRRLARESTQKNATHLCVR
jgi:hypothetical protein